MQLLVVAGSHSCLEQRSSTTPACSARKDLSRGAEGCPVSAIRTDSELLYLLNER